MIEEKAVSMLANQGALGAIAAVAIWGAVRGLRALWGALQRREEDLERAHQEYSRRLEELNAAVADMIRAATEEAARTRQLLAELAGETVALHEDLMRHGGAGRGATATARAAPAAGAEAPRPAAAEGETALDRGTRPGFGS